MKRSQNVHYRRALNQQLSWPSQLNTHAARRRNLRNQEDSMGNTEETAYRAKKLEEISGVYYHPST
jgi:hypothetical protein